jgi:hypothetical protein
MKKQTQLRDNIKLYLKGVGWWCYELDLSGSG